MRKNLPTSENYLEKIKSYNLGKLWRADSIQTEGDREKAPFPEPLGYIGNNYQRFYIHYITVQKDRLDPLVYHITGKTRVKDNICSFSGIITVISARLDKKGYDVPGYRAGQITGEIFFKEDSTQPETGIFRGRISTGFTMDKKNHLAYDALVYVGDRFYNNQCRTTWTSYQTGKTRKCNWGDFRMPDSRELDNGTGDVVIEKKYIKNGWESFATAFGSLGNEEEKKKALKIEDAEWWK